MTRVARITLIGAVLLAAASGLASTAQVEGTQIAPYWEDPTDAELALYDAEVPCPEIPGVEFENRSVTVDQQVEIRCTYRSDAGQDVLTVRWYKVDYDRSASYLCFDDEPGTTGASIVAGVVQADGGLRADYVVQPGRESAAVAAAAEMLAAASAFARDCAEVPAPLDCPEVPGFELEFVSEEVRERGADSYTSGCRYQVPGEDGSATTQAFGIEAWWASPAGVPTFLARLCNEPPTEGTGFGNLVAPGVAANATYDLSAPLHGDLGLARTTAQQLLDQAAEQARSCDGVEVLPTQYEPFPEYLQAVYTPALTSRPGGSSGFDALPGASPSTSSDDGGFIKTAMRIGSVVMLVLSMLGLFISFLLVRRETRVRERRDLLRIGITLTVAVLSIAIVGRDAPLWAVLVAVGLGIAVGTWQGSNLLVRSTERGLFAKRSVLAIAAFALGVLLMQVAGFLNRSGGVAIGVAASFLSAAITAGLFLGRKPRILEAVGTVARMVVPLALAVGVVVGVGLASAQTEPVDPAPAPGTCRTNSFFGLQAADLANCPGWDELLDVVPWADGYITGGLWWNEGKPSVALELSRGLVTPPEPVGQTASWSMIDEFSGATSEFTVTETYTFGSLQDGLCCSVAYEATGTEIITRTDGTVRTETYRVDGRLHDVQPLGVIDGGHPEGIPFTEADSRQEFGDQACQRYVADLQRDLEPGAGEYEAFFSVDGGEEQTANMRVDVRLFVPCDLPEFSYENALRLAPPPPAAGDPARFDGPVITDAPPPEVCPVRQEFARYVWNVGQFDGVDTRTLAELYLEPNAPQCNYGGLPGVGSSVNFGSGARGATRHELLYRLAILNDPEEEAERLNDDEDFFQEQSRLVSIPPHDRCELGPDGVPLAPEGFTTDDPGAATSGGITVPSGDIPTCRYVSLHSPTAPTSLQGLRQTDVAVLNTAGGQVWIETSYVLDGPNVTIRAHLPWGKYVYRCHHCTPGDPAIGTFISSLNRFGTERGMGDPDAGKGDVASTPEAEGEVTTTTQPGFTEETEFTPIGEEEGISTEEAALIGLVGLLGSMGVLATALEGTGLTPADIASAIRSGDFTGGVGTAPPPLLDEDGAPLFVNDGSYPEAPEGYVWWEVDGEGRWVPPEEAEELVAQARAADEAFDEERAEALAEADRRRVDDLADLAAGTRAEAAADRARAALDRARSEILFGSSPEDGGEIGETWEAAMASGEQDLVDFIDRQDGLTPEQIQAIYDAINRRGADQAALDAIPEVNVWRETATGSLNQMADMAEAAGQPAVAWILRNPGTSARVAAAVATGGYSEFIAVPIDITQRLQAAQERSLAENGRMMTSEELFGELGWALGTEAVYEAGGRLVAGGLGRVFGAGDELAEGVLREGDEALPTIRHAADEGMETGARRVGETGGYDDILAREGAEGLEGGGRVLDEGGATRHVESGARGGGDPLAREGLEAELEAAGREGAEGLEGGARSVDEGMPSGASAADEGMSGLDEAAESAGREGAEAAGRQTEELIQKPPKGNEDLAALETGTPIRGEMVEQTGLPRQQLEALEEYTSARGNPLGEPLNVTGRSTNPASREALESGRSIPKPLDIKIKTGNDLDVMLGANPGNRGQVTLFEPRMPDTRGMSPDLVEALERRHASRLKEWEKYKDAWTRGDRVMSVKGTERTHRLIDGRIEVLYDGQWRSYAGDFDLVDITRADGTPLSAAEFNEVVEDMVERGLIEHGGEVRVMTDIMRNNPHPPGSDEWMGAAREAWDLRHNLENAQMDGEIIVGINGLEGVHRGPVIDEVLPWKGGFEAPDGTLLAPESFAGQAGDLAARGGSSVGDLTGAGPAALRGMDDD